MESLLVQIADYLIQQTWHIAILFTIILALSWLLRKASAHWRYLLWCLILAKCLLPPLLTVPLALLPVQNPQPDQDSLLTTTISVEPLLMPVASPLQIIESPDPVSIINTNPIKPAALPKKCWLTLGWLTGMILFLWLAFWKALRVNSRLAIGRKMPDQNILNEIECLKTQLKMKSFPRIWTLPGIGQPFVWGLVRGDIYLPESFASAGTTQHRRNILMHELAHVLRYDPLLNTLQIIAQAIFFFHPLLWWANRKIRIEREKCCDETAIARLAATPKEYSSAIIDTLIKEYNSQQPVPSLAIVGPLKHIEDRIKTIMKPGRRFYHKPTAAAILTALALAAVTIPLAVTLTARAQQTEKKADIPNVTGESNETPPAAAILESEPQPLENTQSNTNTRKTPQKIRYNFYLVEVSEDQYKFLPKRIQVDNNPRILAEDGYDFADNLIKQAHTDKSFKMVSQPTATVYEEQKATLSLGSVIPYIKNIPDSPQNLSDVFIGTEIEVTGTLSETQTRVISQIHLQQTDLKPDINPALPVENVEQLIHTNQMDHQVQLVRNSPMIIYGLKKEQSTMYVIVQSEVAVDDMPTNTDIPPELVQAVGESADRLKEFGEMCIYYMDYNNGKYPVHLSHVEGYYGNHRYGSDMNALENRINWLKNNIQYLGGGLTAVVDKDIPIAYNKTLLEQHGFTHVVFADFRIRLLQENDLNKLGIVSEKIQRLETQKNLNATNPNPVGIVFELKGSKSLGILHSNESLQFYILNNTSEPIEFHENIYHHKWDRGNQYGYIEVIDEQMNQLTHRLSRENDKMIQLAPGKYWHGGFFMGNSLLPIGPGNFKARITLTIHTVNTNKTFQIQSNWYSFTVTLCGYPEDFVPSTPYKEWEEAEAYSMLIEYGHVSREEVINKYLKIIEKYPDTKYELAAHCSLAGAARGRYENTKEDWELERKHYQIVIDKWPNVINRDTIQARFQMFSQDLNYSPSLIDLYKWLLSVTKEQIFISERNYNVLSERYPKSEEQIKKYADTWAPKIEFQALDKMLTDNNGSGHLLKVIEELPGTRAAEIAKQKLHEYGIDNPIILYGRIVWDNGQVPISYSIDSYEQGADPEEKTISIIDEEGYFSIYTDKTNMESYTTGKIILKIVSEVFPCEYLSTKREKAGTLTLKMVYQPLNVVEQHQSIQQMKLLGEAIASYEKTHENKRPERIEDLKTCLEKDIYDHCCPK